MNINRLRTAEYLEQTSKNTGKAAERTRDFRHDLAGNLMRQDNDAVQEQKTQENPLGTEYCQGMMSTGALHNADRLANSAVDVCEVRKLTYDQCDYVKLCPDQGVVYKTRICENGQVYVEEKKEDGTVSAYMVDPDKVADNTRVPLEMAAKEAAAHVQGTALGDTEEAYKKALDKFYVYAGERVKDGPPKFAIGGSEFSIEDWKKLMKSVDEQIDAIKEEIREDIRAREEEAEKKSMDELVRKRELMNEKGPYSFLMGDGPTLIYNGVEFTYDKDNALCLGDMSNPDDVITIYLTGGVFKLNRNNIDDLSKAIGMFSPEDVNRILNAISQDAKCKKKLKEIEDAIYQAVEEAGKQE